MYRQDKPESIGDFKSRVSHLYKMHKENKLNKVLNYDFAYKKQK